MIYTRDYWDAFCGRVLGKPIHHGPTRGGPEESQRFRHLYERTLASYRRWFGESPPEDVWPAPDKRFDPGGRSVRVRPREVWIVPKPWSVF